MALDSQAASNLCFGVGSNFINYDFSGCARVCVPRSYTTPMIETRPTLVLSVFFKNYHIDKTIWVARQSY
jgi:hypothetical protein